MLLKVCANGARDTSEHPTLSSDPSAVAAECAKAIAAGAGAVHIHPKNRRGEESLSATDVDRWVAALRQHCPKVPLGVTTGAWAMPDVTARLHEIDAWQELPDFASVNWHEDGADAVAAKLLERGIGVEAGIWHEQGLRAWAASPVRPRCLRVLVEVQDMTPDETYEVGRSLVDAVHALEPELAVLLHGEERSTWAAIELAGRLGLDTRAGLEDCLTLPDGVPASGNADLVQAALSVHTNRSDRT
ncbi:3-keto-5-aminohexanoate cleavage protein [Dermacoccus abyssi]|uniref:3-keto-5-aminohexanoate cleavage protein n=1 Tax=Dermacoccus abyssi TaxID=322596 RepID=UPI002AD33D59|nr:3-keto-5-aminohexanoate cleavage protein [Dermacoccus abyssi]